MPELSKAYLKESGPLALLAAASSMPEASARAEGAPWVKVGEAGAVLTSMKRDKAIEAAEKLFYASPLAHHMIEQLTDFVVGDGFELTSSNKAAAEKLYEFWHSPVNVLPSNLYAYVQEFFLYGELLFVVKVQPTDGFVTLTYVPPRQIHSVTQKKGIPGIPDKVILKADEDGKKPTYSIIAWDSANQRLAGDAFYFRMQHLGSDVRGFPRLLPLVDFLRAWEAFTYNYIGKRANWDAIWWDVQLDGYTQHQIDDWLKSKYSRPPDPGSVFAHNERVTWNMVQADFRESAFERDSGFFLDFFMGASGLSSMSQVGRRWEKERPELLDPVARSLSTRQFEVRSCFSFIGSFVLQEAIRFKQLADNTYEVLCQAPRLGVRDFQRSAGALKKFVEAMNLAAKLEWVDFDEARQVFRDMLARLGMIDRALPPKGPEEVEPEKQTHL